MVWASLVAQMVKASVYSAGGQGSTLGQKDPLQKEMQPTPVLLPGKSHGPRSLVGPSPWGRKRVRHDLATEQQQN